jgi:GT2 family glycosyltransferase
VVVCHDSAGPETDELLASHPLGTSGNLRAMRHSRSSAGEKRNVAARLARGATLVFTDDDCRPPEDWLSRVRDAVRRHEGAIVQGPVQGDPDELAMRHAPYWRTLYLPHPPGPWAESCNIVYPRKLFERAGGFPEDLASGEDTELAILARATGAPYVGDDGMLTYHAVDDLSLRDWIRGTRRWGDLALLFKRHPEFRRELALGIFWKRTHAWLPLALAGVALERRNRLWALLVVPWAVQWEPRHGGVRGRIRHLMELPGWALIDLSEIASLVRGSIRHRSLLL